MVDMTAQEYMAAATERAAAFMAHFVEATPPEKRDWTPTLESAAGLRSALDMVDECIVVNHALANVLKGSPSPTSSPASSERCFSDWEDGKARLLESAQVLAGVIRSLPDDALNNNFTTRRGEMPGFLVIEIPSRNMNYHVGQINLIQLLYGDTTYHFPTPKK